MSNFELIDDYLTDRLNEQEKKSFEQQMTSDPALKADVVLQKEIIEGLKHARAAELKAMLNNVPVATPSLYFSPLRLAAGIIGTAMLATGLYLYYENKGNINSAEISSSFTDSIKQTEQSTPVVQPDSVFTELNDKVDYVDKKNADTKNQADENRARTKVKENKPAIDLLDPTEELTDQENDIAPAKINSSNGTISVAKIEIAINSSERKFKSHYQFANGKLILYGNFDDGLYEIIEVNAQNSRSLFLYYNVNYYLLDNSKKEITLLKEISDPVLIQKLKVFRAN